MSVKMQPFGRGPASASSGINSPVTVLAICTPKFSVLERPADIIGGEEDGQQERVPIVQSVPVVEVVA